ncbi:hypothetical protein E2C01_040550 [Portunus trituberculatus]|uniref:Uncharacterized protein n=1 Tax=Portunus trituberculatus TaxID=210409 RepID=A0A5B7FGZ6_PORTR|nr:hypothetical protein [Portunus trituberculatus]
MEKNYYSLDVAVEASSCVRVGETATVGDAGAGAATMVHEDCIRALACLFLNTFFRTGQRMVLALWCYPQLGRFGWCGLLHHTQSSIGSPGAGAILGLVLLNLVASVACHHRDVSLQTYLTGDDVHAKEQMAPDTALSAMALETKTNFKVLEHGNLYACTTVAQSWAL